MTSVVTDRVVDAKPPKVSASESRARASTSTSPANTMPAVVEDEQQQQDAGDPGPRRAPAEPVQGPRHQLGDDELLGVGVSSSRANGPLTKLKK